MKSSLPLRNQRLVGMDTCAARMHAYLATQDRKGFSHFAVRFSKGVPCRTSPSIDTDCLVSL
jgi:hypothetical protein